MGAHGDAYIYPSPADSLGHDRYVCVYLVFHIVYVLREIHVMNNPRNPFKTVGTHTYKLAE